MWEIILHSLICIWKLPREQNYHLPRPWWGNCVMTRALVLWYCWRKKKCEVPGEFFSCNQLWLCSYFHVSSLIVWCTYDVLCSLEALELQSCLHVLKYHSCAWCNTVTEVSRHSLPCEWCDFIRKLRQGFKRWSQEFPSMIEKLQNLPRRSTSHSAC